MSFLSDALGFEEFALKDLWKQIEDDPWRMLVGFGPLETEVSNTLFGRDDDPLLNIMGGPMGSGWLGLGSGGVYDRARESGVDPSSANKLHDTAEVLAGVLAMIFGGGALLGGGAGGAGGGGGTLATGSTAGGGSAATTASGYLGTGPGMGAVDLGAFGGGTLGGGTGATTLAGANTGATAGATSGSAGFWNNPNNLKLLGQLGQGFGEGMQQPPRQIPQIAQRGRGGTLGTGAPAAQSTTQANAAQIATANALLTQQAMQRLAAQQGLMGQNFYG